MNVDALLEYAYKILELSIEYNKLHKYIAGIPPFYSVPADPNVKLMSADPGEECHFVKMEAIYRYHTQHPEYRIDQKTYHILEEYTVIVKGSTGFLNILGLIEQQVVAEAEGRAPFQMDFPHLLDNLKTNLHTNKKLYTSQIYQDIGFMATIEQRNASLKANYGYSIL